MQSSQSRSSVLGYVLLLIAFVAAGIAFASAGVRAWSEEGLSAPTIVAALVVLGTMSLTQRYLKVAMSLKRERIRRR